MTLVINMSLLNELQIRFYICRPHEVAERRSDDIYDLMISVVVLTA